MNKKDLHEAIESIDANKAIKNQIHKYINSLEKADIDAIPVNAKEAAQSFIDATVAKKEKSEGKKPSKPKAIHIDKVLSGLDSSPIIDPEGKDVTIALPDTCETPIRVRQKPESKGSVTVAINKEQSHKLPSPPGFTDFYNTGECSWSFLDKGI